MRPVKAVFVKQVIDLVRNWAVLIQVVVFPLVALVFTELVAKADEGIPDTMFVTMFAAVFAGMSMTITASSILAEDRETGALRFLVMAGVKPHQYLAGVGGVLLVISAAVAVVFALLGGFSGTTFVVFVAVMWLGSAASVILGATLGLLAKNQQAALGLAMPLAMVVGFVPMLTLFNDTIAKAFAWLYTQQVNVVANDLTGSLARPVLVIGANMVVLVVLFGLVYRRKGLRS